MSNTFKLIGIAVAVAIVFATASCDDGSLPADNNNIGNVQIDPQYHGIWIPRNPSSLVSVEVTASTINFTWSGNSYGYDGPFGPFTGVTTSSISSGNVRTYHIYSNADAKVLIWLTLPYNEFGYMEDMLHFEIKLPNKTDTSNFDYFNRSE